MILDAYDTQNRHTGPTSDSTWEANIPGSFYFANNLADTTSPRMILLPNGDTYEVRVVSQSSNSSFELSLKNFNDGFNTTESIFTNVPIFANTIAICSFDSLIENLNLNLDWDGDGAIDTTILSSPAVYCKNEVVDSNWNLISIPYLTELKLKSELFPTAVSQAFWYNSTQYVIQDSLEAKKGYWLKFDQIQNSDLCGIRVNSDTINIKQGWNMIGILDKNIPVSQLTTEPQGSLISNFFGYSGGYIIADTLRPGFGYWIKSSSDGIILLNTPLRKEGGNVVRVSLDWASITITDALSREMKLYLNEDADKELFILPPMPPEGAFDIRFTSDLMVENLNNESRIVSISGAKYPLRIKVGGINLTVKDLISGNLLNELIRDGNDLVIYDTQIDKIIISGNYANEIPTKFNLEQNYPNPFNPNTKIRFSIPKEVQVNVSIFNILGEKVKELKNELMKPGYYDVEFNATGFASGVYLYRIKAGDFVETKKMILLK